MKRLRYMLERSRCASKSSSQPVQSRSNVAFHLHVKVTMPQSTAVHSSCENPEVLEWHLAYLDGFGNARLTPPCLQTQVPYIRRDPVVRTRKRGTNASPKFLGNEAGAATAKPNKAGRLAKILPHGLPLP